MAVADNKDGIYALEGRVLDTLERVSISEDTVLVVRAPNPESARELQPFAKFLKDQVAQKYGFPNILVVIMTEGMAIESLDHEAMARYGWVRMATEPPPGPTFH